MPAILTAIRLLAGSIALAAFAVAFGAAFVVIGMAMGA